MASKLLPFCSASASVPLAPIPDLFSVDPDRGRNKLDDDSGQSVKVLVTQSCLSLCDPMDCSPPSSSVHGISQVKILESVAISSSRGSSRPRDLSNPCLLHWQADSLPLSHL